MQADTRMIFAPSPRAASIPVRALVSPGPVVVNTTRGCWLRMGLDRRESRARFVPEMHDFYVAVGERPPKRRDCAAGNAESVANAEVRKGFDHRLADRLRRAARLGDRPPPVRLPSLRIHPISGRSSEPSLLT